MTPIVQLANVFSNRSTTDARVHLHIHKVSERQRRLFRLHRQLSRRRQNQPLNLSRRRIQHLTQRQRNHRRLTRTALRLRDDIPPRDYRNDRSLLNSARFLKPVRVQASQQILSNPHRIKRRARFNPLGRFKRNLLIIIVRFHQIVSRSSTTHVARVRVASFESDESHRRQKCENLISETTLVSFRFVSRVRTVTVITRPSFSLSLSIDNPPLAVSWPDYCASACDVDHSIRFHFAPESCCSLLRVSPRRAVAWRHPACRPSGSSSVNNITQDPIACVRACVGVYDTERRV